MAIHAPITGAPVRATLLPAADSPIGRVLARYDRPHLEAFLTVAIELLDFMDGDADTEEDDSDCCAAHEDDASAFGGPVMGFGADDTQQDPDHEITYPEWHTLPAAQKQCGTFVGSALDTDLCRLGLADDAEAAGDEQDLAWCEPDRWDYRQRTVMVVGRRNEDDEQDDESGDFLDKGEDYCHYLLPPKYGEDQSTGPINEVEILRDHRNRMMNDPKYRA